MVAKTQQELAPLRGWAAIARFLGQPVATAQHWGKTGMPVRKQGRYITADPVELSRWLGRESQAPAPVQIAGHERDLTEELRAGLAAARHLHRRKRTPR